ncbi:hypothetical protein JYT85_01410 [Desulfocapsa sp. AH-315-G09]|uniref:Transposase n=1 Tax=Desulfotalea psychrophila TaxID=84980 RepID=A0ABS3AUU2_9BACT|nr:hypothetical protein [Desulfocapsa sp.]MBN4065285.1 hypothetical protein [Desulfocapsa sp. AH-315-G09]MBN4068864.1 hypothetical protein [Desulfotalea psychrophila]
MTKNERQRLKRLEKQVLKQGRKIKNLKQRICVLRNRVVWERVLGF